MQPVFDNRVGWARTYLKNAGLVESTRRGYFRITARGQTTLNQKPAKIDLRYLEQFPEFQEFRTTKRKLKPRRHQTPLLMRVWAAYQTYHTLAGRLAVATKKVNP
jgi:restriction system protein